MKKTYIVVLLFFTSINIYSQTQNIIKTWQIYEQANQLRQQTTNQNVYIVEQNHILPTTGQQKINYKLFFKTELTENIENPYEQVLTIAEKNYNIDKNRYSEEFLFENNELLYFYRKEYFGSYRELRFYFNQNSIEKITVSFFDEQTGKNLVKSENINAQKAKELYSSELDYIINEQNKITKIFNAVKIY